MQPLATKRIKRHEVLRGGRDLRMMTLSMSPRMALCFGEMLWDMLPQGRFAGGAPFNVGYHLSSLGWRSVPVSAVGDDPLGHELLGLLEVRGMDPRGVAVLKGTPTGTVAVELDRDGKPRFEIRRDVAWDAVPVPDHVIEAARSADVVVFGSLAQRTTANRQSLGRLLAASVRAMKVFDVNLRPPHDDEKIVRELFSSADLIKLNDEELDRLTDCGNSKGAIETGARMIGEMAPDRAVCVTCGAVGAGLLWNKRWHWEPTRPVSVVDTVGAGDAFLAALVAGLENGWPAADALSGACRLGEWVASRSGATPAYRARSVGTAWEFSDSPK